MPDSTSSTKFHNVIIIGSGPAGYTAALYAARAGLEPLVLAGELAPGGELMNTTLVENYPGFPEGIDGPDLMAAMEEQVGNHGATVEYVDATKVTFAKEPGNSEGPEDFHVVETSDGEVLSARVVIVSTGSAYRHLGVPGEEEHSGGGVSWCATCDGALFKGQDMIVVGGGDSALEQATFLSRYSSNVTIIHRRDEFRASKALQERARNNPSVRIVMDTEVTEILDEVVKTSILGESRKVAGVATRNTVTGEEGVIGAKAVFVSIGSDPRTDLFPDLKKREDGYLWVEGRSSVTNIPGVFACGDVTDPVYRQAVTAAGSGCVAALDAESYLASLGI